MTRKKIITLALVAVIVVTVVAGASIAYFSDNKTARNTFTMGNVEIALDEAPIDNEGHAVDGDRVIANDYGIEAVYPGAVLDKDPTVHNTGSNPAYIRATVNVSDWVNLCSTFYPDFKATFPNEGYEEALALLVGNLGDGWSVVGVESGDTFQNGQQDAKFILKYADVLAAGEDTTPMFTKVYIPTTFGDNGNNAETFKEIKITAQAMQTNGFASWEDAFNAFDGN